MENRKLGSVELHFADLIWGIHYVMLALKMLAKRIEHDLTFYYLDIVV